MITAVPAQSQAKEMLWERPILQATIELDTTRRMDIFNVHLKSKIPTDIPGQKLDNTPGRVARRGLKDHLFPR